MGGEGASGREPLRQSSTDVDEEVRAFYQRRLAMMFGVMAAFVGLISLTGWLFLIFMRPVTLRAVIPRIAGTVTCAVLLLLWRWCRQGRLSHAALDRLDASAILLHTYIFLATTGASLAGGKIGAFQVMTVSYLLMARAIIVPSSGPRTLKLTLAATIPTTVVATYLRVHDPSMKETLGQALLAMGQPMIVTTLLVYFASRVIFGLRKQVRAASKVGQYVLENKIGEGGMGVVYRATHAMLRREAAVKLLWPDLVGEAHLARFEREVTLTARLTHPNTIAVFDYGRTPEGVFYYTMEYLDGVSLEQLVEVEGPLPPGRVVHLLAQACGALAEAHRIGLIHRDVKPANVLVCERGGVPDHVKVLDFGLVKDLADPSVVVSSVGAIIGTPLFMAPEAIHNAEQIDARADIYALGALGYYLLAGSPPFRGPTPVEACFQHLHEPVEPISERTNQPIPASLEALILRCLAKTPALRPATMTAVRAALLAGDDFVPWTEADGARWWAERGALVRARALARRRSDRDSLPSKRTIAVELGNRSLARP
jgi:hypothetical protein